MKTLLPFTFILLIPLASCMHLYANQSADQNKANKHMHGNHSHNDLIKRFDDPARDQWQQPEKVIKLLAPIKNQKIMDIGVGSGYFSHYFIKAGAIVVGADVDQKFLDFVNQKFPIEKFPNFTSRKIEYQDPKVEAEEFDLIFLCNTYHHIENRDEYLKKVLKGLKHQSGRIAIVDFKANSASHIGPPQKMRLSADLVKKELSIAGFSKIEILSNELPEQYIILGHKTDHTK